MDLRQAETIIGSFFSSPFSMWHQARRFSGDVEGFAEWNNQFGDRVVAAAAVEELPEVDQQLVALGAKSVEIAQSLGYSPMDYQSAEAYEAIAARLAEDERFQRLFPDRIQNRDRFPDVAFLPESEFRIIGNVEGVPLLHIGTEQATGSKIVAKSFGNSSVEELWAIDLGELIAHTFGAIALAEAS